ncbi:cell division protein FtsQ/DivIB [Luteimonas sp. M1R5S59]|uniref:Cell division protein FtsQ n=1 Tax=Luteimonas kalidii TaxID=3042025 RepID=A0ABT6JR99_9GAMM|nr:cell division protein FtsQ/DivIB [Luteimonas kalidii]MDH5833022.1 cell division protein FtsQ/DivIB [Luteimonas kalidii]
MRRTLQVVAWALAIALVALPVVALVNGWIGAERWPLRTLRVTDGLERVDPERLREVLLPHASSGFFAVRLDHAQAAVARLPWVEHAEVRKLWPDVLEVRIVEHRPFARWGSERLLSEQGRLFPVAGIDVPAGLPELQGPDARVPDVVALYNEARELFVPGGFAVAKLALDRRDSWSLTLDNGVEVTVGSQEARLRLQRFARVLPQLLTRAPQPLRRADLRYTNGFALEWATPDADGDAADAAVVPGTTTARLASATRREAIGPRPHANRAPRSPVSGSNT